MIWVYAQVSGRDMRPFADELFPVLIEILHDSSSHQKREVRSIVVVTEVVDAWKVTTDIQADREWHTYLWSNTVYHRLFTLLCAADINKGFGCMKRTDLKASSRLHIFVLSVLLAVFMASAKLWPQNSLRCNLININSNISK